MTFSITLIPTNGSPVKSLAWQGDNLVDWVSGRVVYGSSQKQTPKIDDRFDSATVSNSGRFIAVYDRYGREAVLF